MSPAIAGWFCPTCLISWENSATKKTTFYLTGVGNNTSTETALLKDLLMAAEESFLFWLSKVIIHISLILFYKQKKMHHISSFAVTQP